MFGDVADDGIRTLDDQTLSLVQPRVGAAHDEDEGACVDRTSVQSPTRDRCCRRVIRRTGQPVVPSVDPPIRCVLNVLIAASVFSDNVVKQKWVVVRANPCRSRRGRQMG